MTDFFDLIRHEEGWKSRPYVCSQGYPTVGFGFKIGPKFGLIKNYDFTLPLAAGEVWMACIAHDIIDDIKTRHHMAEALQACMEADGTTDNTVFEGPRTAVLLSMCYQMGVEGVAQFRQTLKFMALKSFSNAAAEMKKSVWYNQTRARADRHCAQMHSGKWDKVY